MKKSDLLKSIALTGILLSAPAFANTNPYNDPAFDPDAKISLNQEETQEINARLGADKSAFENAAALNERRNKVIETCGQYLDDQFSDASVAKTKECLRINDGYFPVEYQIQPNTPSLPKHAESNSYQQQAQMTNQSVQSENNKPETVVPVENKPNDDYLFGVLR